MARPTKRTDHKINVILEHLRNGMSRGGAAAMVGISRTTLVNWCEEDAALAEKVLRAEAEAELVATSRIRREIEREDDKGFATGQWTAAAWWLERRRREDYALSYSQPGTAAMQTQQIPIQLAVLIQNRLPGGGPPVLEDTGSPAIEAEVLEDRRAATEQPPPDLLPLRGEEVMGDPDASPEHDLVIERERLMELLGR